MSRETSAASMSSSSACIVALDGKRLRRMRLRRVRTGRRVAAEPSHAQDAAATVFPHEKGARRPEGTEKPVRRGQFTLTALQAAATALYSVLPAPYRSFAALSVAVRAPA